jgi:hypothetical protein
MSSETFNGVQISNYTSKFPGATYNPGIEELNGNLYYFDSSVPFAGTGVGSITPAGGFTSNKVYIFASSPGGNGNNSTGGGGSARLITDINNITSNLLSTITSVQVGFNAGDLNKCLIQFLGSSDTVESGDTIMSGNIGAGGMSTNFGQSGVYTIAGGNGGNTQISPVGTNGTSVDFGVKKVYFSGGGGAAGGTAGGYPGGNDGFGSGAGRVISESESDIAITDSGSAPATSSTPAANGEGSGPNDFGGGGGCGFGGGGGAGSSNGGTGAAGAVFIFVVAPPAPPVPARPVTISGSTETSLEVSGDFSTTSGGPFTKATFELYDSESVSELSLLQTLESIETSGNFYNLGFSSLTPAKDYWVRWFLSNEGGDGPASELVKFRTLGETTSTLPKPVLVSKTSSTITVRGDSTGVSGAPFTGATFYIGYKGGEIAEDKEGTTDEYTPGIYTHVFTKLDANKSYDISWSLSINGVEGNQSELIDGGVRTNANGNPICFLRGSKILCLNKANGGKEEYIPIEEMRVGTPVKTLNGSFVKVHSIGKKMFNNPDNADRGPNRLFKLSPANYPELTEDLIITGCHSRLVDKLEPKQKARHLQLMKNLYMTTGKFRLMAFIDEKAEPYQNPGSHEIWHFALENEEEVCNYGVYANGGLLVETASIKIMRDRSGLVPIE